MGTAASHAGSSKDWDAVADDDDLNDWFDSLPDATGEGDEPDDEDVAQPPDENRVPPIPRGALSGIARALQSTSYGLGSGGGSAASGDGGGGVGGSGGRTIGASAGRAGGRTVAGVSAYQRGDAATLDELGLSLGDLEALDDDWDRAVAIADAAVGDDPSGADDEDARWASVQTVTWALAREPPPETREIIERFVADYVYRKVSYEIGRRRREGNEDGADSVASERSLRAGIRISVHSEIRADFDGAASVADVSDLAARVYERTLEIWAEP